MHEIRARWRMGGVRGWAGLLTHDARSLSAHPAYALRAQFHSR